MARASRSLARMRLATCILQILAGALFAMILIPPIKIG